jgi:SAM-dependent methyltransferase
MAHDYVEYRRACDAFSRGEEIAALDVLKSLAEANTRLWEVYNDLGVLATARGDVSAALIFLQKSCNLENSSDEARMNLALLQKVDQQYEAALSTLSPLLRLRNHEPEILILVREILGASPTLSAVVWARLLADLRALPPDSDLSEETASDLSPDGQGADGKRYQSGQEGSADPTVVFSTCSRVPDSAWQQVMLNSVDSVFFNGVQLPGFADSTLQRNTVGSSGRQALHEGFTFYSLLKKYAHKYSSPLHQASRILDFGCGWGRYIRYFLKDTIATNVYGVDVDSVMVAACEESFPYGNFSQVNPFPPFDFPDKHFDLIFAYSVFSHLSAPAADAWIQEFSRVLSPGGLLVVTTQGREFIQYCQQIRDKIAITGQVEHPWHTNLAKSFENAEACLVAYDRGEHLFEATGGGDARPSTFYGEALVPKEYAQRVWGQYLQFRDFVDDRSILPQAFIVMQKSELERGN